MRYQEREITDRVILEELLHQGTILYLGMCEGERPYVLPLSYGYDGQAIYIHSSLEGRKVDILSINPQVSFVIEPLRELNTADRSCKWGYRYRSVVGEGIITQVVDPEAKATALDVLMHQHGGTGGDYGSKALAHTLILRLEITNLSGKQSGY